MSTNTISRLLWCLACALTLILSAPGPVSADDTPTLSARDKRKARNLIKQAKAHHKAADKLAGRKGERNQSKARATYLKAAKAYREAYSTLEMPALLVPLAQIYKARGERAFALRTFKKYIELKPDGPLVDDAQRAIADLETELAEAKAAGQEEPAGEPSIDPTDIIGPEPEPVVEEPEEPEEPAGDGDGTADEGEQPLDLKTRPPRARPGRLFKWSGIGAAAVGAALVGTGIGFGVSAQSVADQLSANDDGWTAEDRELIATGESRETSMYIFTSVGAAFLVGGAALFYLGMRADQRASGDQAEKNAFLTPSITPDGATLTVTGRF